MKKIILLSCLSFLYAASLTSCKEYTSLTNASKITQLKGNPFIYNVSKSLLKNTTNYMASKGLKSAITKINLLTPLSSIITSPDQIEGYANMLSNFYSIPSGKLIKRYSTLSSVKDLIYFVANNGQKFNFYSN